MCWWWLAPTSQAKIGLCQWPWGLWGTHAATSREGQRPASPCGRIKGPQNARGAQGQEELLRHRPEWVALWFLLPTANVTSGWDIFAVVSPLTLPPSWAQASQQFEDSPGRENAAKYPLGWNTLQPVEPGGCWQGAGGTRASPLPCGPSWLPRAVPAVSHNRRKCNTKQKGEMVKRYPQIFEHSTVHSCLLSCSQGVCTHVHTCVCVFMCMAI